MLRFDNANRVSLDGVVVIYVIFDHIVFTAVTCVGGKKTPTVDGKCICGKIFLKTDLVLPHFPVILRLSWW